MEWVCHYEDQITVLSFLRNISREIVRGRFTILQSVPKFGVVFIFNLF